MKNKSKGDVEQSLRKKRRFWGGVALFINSYLLLSFLFGEMGMLKWAEMKRSYAQLQQEILSLKRENEKLSQRIEALKGDPHFIENLARDRLGLVKEGELVYEFYD